MWWARKAEDASTSGPDQEAVHDEEVLEFDEEDNSHHATVPSSVTNVPLPTTTDLTRASVDQLSALAMSSKDDEISPNEQSATAIPPIKTEDPSSTTEMDQQTTPTPTSNNEDPVPSSADKIHPSGPAS
jgi:hypothetical protein